MRVLSIEWFVWNAIFGLFLLMNLVNALSALKWKQRYMALLLDSTKLSAIQPSQVLRDR